MGWHRHRWVPRSVEHGTMTPTGRVTLVLYGCECGDFEVKDLLGIWTWEQLFGPALEVRQQQRD